MSISRALPASVLLAACNGNGDGQGTDDDTDGPEPPPYFEFVSTVEPKFFDAEVAEEAIDAHRVSSMLLAATSVVVADEKVQDRLNVDGGGSTLRAAYLACWSRPQYPMFSFAIDYTPCSSFQMGGGVFVDDHASGPLLFEFENFSIFPDAITRSITGTLALDTRDAFPAPLYWQAYNTDSDNPGLDNPVPIGVNLDRKSYGTAYAGGASVDFLAQQWSMWGTLTIGESDPLVVVHGGRVPEDVAPDEPSGADVLKSSLNWLSCRCPTSGISSYDMPLHFSEVTLDIDDLEVDPDEVDDPDLVIPLDYDVDGRGVLTHTGCGTYDVDYDSDTVTIPLSVDRLVGAVSFLCDTRTIADLQRCNALVAAAGRLEGDLQIEVSADDADQTALTAVEQDFDTTWCRIY